MIENILESLYDTFSIFKNLFSNFQMTFCFQIVLLKTIYFFSLNLWSKIDFFGTSRLVFSNPEFARSTSTKSPNDSALIEEEVDV